MCHIHKRGFLRRKQGPHSLQQLRNAPKTVFYMLNSIQDDHPLPDLSPPPARPELLQARRQENNQAGEDHGQRQERYDHKVCSGCVLNIDVDSVCIGVERVERLDGGRNSCCEHQEDKYVECKEYKM